MQLTNSGLVGTELLIQFTFMLIILFSLIPGRIDFHASPTSVIPVNIFIDSSIIIWTTDSLILVPVVAFSSKHWITSLARELFILVVKGILGLAIMPIAPAPRYFKNLRLDISFIIPPISSKWGQISTLNITF
ncbi:hypothetical protein ES703_24859 [subsurface metagenome]